MFSGKFEVKGRKVLITGGSQGLGAELALKCVERGANVTILARTKTKLIETVKRIESKKIDKDQLVDYRAVDLSDYEATAVALKDINADVVFFCAGASIPKIFTDLTPTELKQGIDINLKTSINVSHIIMKQMIQEKKLYNRHFIYCSSILAIYPFIGYGQYAPSKAGIRALSDILRQEGAPFGIKVHTIFAGNFKSEGFDKEELTKPEITRQIEGPSDAISVDKCSSIILKYLDQGYEIIFTDFIGWFLYGGMLGFSPTVFWIVQPFLAFLIALISPIYRMMVNRDITNYYKKQK